MVLQSFSLEIHLFVYIHVLVYSYSIMMLYINISHAENLLERISTMFVNFRITHKKDLCALHADASEWLVITVMMASKNFKLYSLVRIFPWASQREVIFRPNSGFNEILCKQNVCLLCLKITYSLLKTMYLSDIWL